MNLLEEKQKVETELRQLQNRQKILLNKKANAERKARTHRLIERGAILESVFPTVAAMTGEEVKSFLLSLSRLPGAGKAAAKSAKARTCSKSLGSRAHLCTVAGACALRGLLRPLAAMGRYSPQTPSEPHGTEHPRCGSSVPCGLIIPPGGRCYLSQSITVPSRLSSAARAVQPSPQPPTEAARS